MLIYLLEKNISLIFKKVLLTKNYFHFQYLLFKMTNKFIINFYHYFFQFDDLSHKSSTSSLNSSAAPNNAWKNSENLARDNNRNSSSPHPSRGTPDSSKDIKLTNTPPSKPPRFALNNSSSVSNLSSKIQEKTQHPNVEDEWGQKLYGLQTGSALKRFVNTSACIN